MSTQNDDKKKLINHLLDESEEGGQTGTEGGGASGEIPFRYQDILSVGLRDDLVTGKELKRILSVHNDLHKTRVDEQKLKRKERKLQKEGRTSLTSRSDAVIANRGRGGVGGSSAYKKHPISDKAQFSGIDRQVTALPSDNLAETNKNESEELKNRNELRNRLTNRYTPKPRPY